VIATTLIVTSKSGTMRRNIFLRIVPELLVTANVLISPSFFSLMMEAIHSSETSVPTRASWLHSPEDEIHHNEYCYFNELICFMSASRETCMEE
jgi:hypothetical protein